jgi:hypothetical protein
MNKSLTAALVGCLAVVACLGLFTVMTVSGCGPSAGGVVIPNAPVADEFGDRPVDANKIVDSPTSWKKFVAEAKTPERIQQAEKKFSEGGPANTVKLIFRSDEIEYAIFGDKSGIKGIEPTRLYEVGVMTVSAKENWGGDGYQIRDYVLKFITPRRDGEWKFIMGTYRVSKYSGLLAGDPNQLRYVEEKEYQNGYLRQLFVKSLPANKSGAAAVNHQGGEQAVETKVNPK